MSDHGNLVGDLAVGFLVSLGIVTAMVLGSLLWWWLA